MSGWNYLLAESHVILLRPLFLLYSLLFFVFFLFFLSISPTNSSLVLSCFCMFFHAILYHLNTFLKFGEKTWCILGLYKLNNRNVWVAIFKYCIVKWSTESWMKFRFVNMKRSCGSCADLWWGFESLWVQACLLSYRELYVPDRGAMKINVCGILWRCTMES